MEKAEEFLAESGIPNIKWSKPIDFQDDVKDGMEFPNSFSEIMEAYLQSRVEAELKKHYGNQGVASISHQITNRAKIEALEQLLKQ